MKRTNPIFILFVIVFCKFNLAEAGTLEFTQASYTVAENGSTFDVTVSRTGNVSAGASVTVRSNSGTATVAEDFGNMSQVLTWTAGETTSKSVIVSILDDALVEGDEEFSLELTSFVGDTAGAIVNADVTITDFEEGTLSFLFSSFSTNENSSTAGVNIVRQSGFNGDVSVVLTTADGTAMRSDDYEESEILVEFLEGESIQVVHVPLINDSIAEFPEVFEVSLATPEGGVTLGSTQTATITISDSDTDFTPALTLIESDVDEINRPPRVSLNQSIMEEVDTTLLEAVNGISVLETTDLSIDQATDGLLELPIGDETIYLSPTLATKTDAEPSIILRDDLSGELITNQGVSITFQPALKGLSVLQTELALLSMPELVVTTEGNITVQINQGPPPLERNSDGVVVVNNSYWNRFNLRPSSVGSLSPAASEGIQLVPHPSLPEESSVVVVFNDGSQFRQQLLDVAPLSYSELENYVQQSTTLNQLTLLGNGLMELEADNTTISLFADYVVRRVADFEAEDVGISQIGDINGDQLADYNIVYSTGDEQYLFSVSSF